MCKRMEGKTAATLAPVEAEALNYSKGHRVLHYHTHKGKGKKSECDLRMSSRRQHFFNFIKFWPSSTGLSHGLWRNGNIHRHSCYRQRPDGRSKKTHWVTDLRAGHFSHLFSLERGTDSLWLFRLQYLSDIVLKMSKISLSLQEEQLVGFVANDKIQVFRRKLGTCKTCVHLWKLDRFPILKDFLFLFLWDH